MSVSINIEKKISGMVMKLSFDSLSKTLGILGTAESGKSLLFRCIAGIETPDSGKIQVNGKILFDSSKKINLKAGNRKIGYLFSDYALFPNLTVEQNILCGYQGKNRFRDRKVEEYIHRFDLEDVADSRPSVLTEEQKLCTALARILIGEPQLILIDEPSRGREGSQKETLYLILKKYLREWNGDYILASQDPEEIRRLCERIIVPGEGVAGSTERIFAQPETIGTAYMTGVQNFSKIEILDEYHVKALDWGIALRTEQEVTSDIKYIGIRSWDLCATEFTGQNCMPVLIKDSRQGISSVEYEVLNDGDDGEVLLWRTYTEVAYPEYLYFPPDKLMLLK